jgi:S1-C subfamily serine protease
MRSFLLKIFFILIIGALGGIIFQAFILPYLTTMPFFQKFQFIRMLRERQVIINQPPATVIIQENVALQKSIEKVEKVVVGVNAQNKKGKILAEGSGLILTADGHFVTLASLVPAGADFNFLWGEEKLAFQIIKRDSKNNLALIKFDKNDLPTAGFVDSGEIKLGERVFLLGVIFEGDKTKKVVNEGIIKSFNEDSIKTNIFEDSRLQGSPLFNIEGKVVGLITIDKTGQVSAIPIEKIKEFTNF